MILLKFTDGGQLRRTIQPPAEHGIKRLWGKNHASKDGEEGDEGGGGDVAGAVGLGAAKHEFDRAQPGDFPTCYAQDPTVSNRPDDTRWAVDTS